MESETPGKVEVGLVIPWLVFSFALRFSSSIIPMLVVI